MAVAVRPLVAAATAAWDAFVAQHPDGTFFHRGLWQTIIERAFGHRTFYVYAETDGAITGVLPLAQVRSLLFGNTLISVPFCVYGGPLAADQETAAALFDHAAWLLERTGAGAVEFRFRGPGGGGGTGCPPGSLAEGWVQRPELYVTFRKPIDAGHDNNLKAIPRKQRAMVRKAIQHGMRSVAHRDVRQLHGIYAESVRNLGTPVFSRRYFDLLADGFGSDCDIVTVLDGDDAVASVMNFWFRDEVLPYYGGGTTRARRCAGNDFMYWEVMRRAADRGCRLFDFGRSKLGTGAFDFKKNWGFVAQPLGYQYKLAAGGTIPDHNPLNPRYRRFIAAWKRLPLPIANALGPVLVRGLG